MVAPVHQSGSSYRPLVTGWHAAGVEVKAIFVACLSALAVSREHAIGGFFYWFAFLSRKCSCQHPQVTSRRAPPGRVLATQDDDDAAQEPCQQLGTAAPRRAPSAARRWLDLPKADETVAGSDTTEACAGAWCIRLSSDARGGWPEVRDPERGGRRRNEYFEAQGALLSVVCAPAQTAVVISDLSPDSCLLMGRRRRPKNDARGS